MLKYKLICYNCIGLYFMLTCILIYILFVYFIAKIGLTIVILILLFLRYIVGLLEIYIVLYLDLILLWFYSIAY